VFRLEHKDEGVLDEVGKTEHLADIDGVFILVQLGKECSVIVVWQVVSGVCS
jgi:hypothetical protein